MTETAQPDASALPQAPAPAGRASHPLRRFLVRRLAQGFLTLVVASIVVFLAASAIPGSPATAILGRNASPGGRRGQPRLGLDKPLEVRYGNWLGGFVQGNLGNSAVEQAQGSRERADLEPDLGHR